MGDGAGGMAPVADDAPRGGEGPGDVASGPVGRADSDSPPADAIGEARAEIESFGGGATEGDMD